jgi:hypothetical protein
LFTFSIKYYFGCITYGASRTNQFTRLIPGCVGAALNYPRKKTERFVVQTDDGEGGSAVSAGDRNAWPVSFFALFASIVWAAVLVLVIHIDGRNTGNGHFGAAPAAVIAQGKPSIAARTAAHIVVRPTLADTRHAARALAGIASL